MIGIHLSKDDSDGGSTNGEGNDIILLNHCKLCNICQTTYLIISQKRIIKHQTKDNLTKPIQTWQRLTFKLLTQELCKINIILCSTNE